MDNFRIDLIRPERPACGNSASWRLTSKRHRIFTLTFTADVFGHVQFPVEHSRASVDTALASLPRKLTLTFFASRTWGVRHGRH